MKLFASFRVPQMALFAVMLSSVFSTSVAQAESRPERLLLATQEWRPYQYQERGVMKGPGITQLKCAMKVLKQPYQITMTDWDRAQILIEVAHRIRHLTILHSAVFLINSCSHLVSATLVRNTHKTGIKVGKYNDNRN